MLIGDTSGGLNGVVARQPALVGSYLVTNVSELLQPASAIPPSEVSASASPGLSLMKKPPIA